MTIFFVPFFISFFFLINCGTISVLFYIITRDALDGYNKFDRRNFIPFFPLDSTISVEDIIERSTISSGHISICRVEILISDKQADCLNIVPIIG